MREKGRSVIEMTWRGAEGDQVRVLVNDVLHATTPNSGSYRFQPEGKGRKSYMFQVCENEGLLRCSSAVSMAF